MSTAGDGPATPFLLEDHGIPAGIVTAAADVLFGIEIVAPLGMVVFAST